MKSAVVSTCHICFDDVTQLEMASLKCKHQACYNCFNMTWSNKIKDKFTILRCIANDDCKMVAEPDEIKMIMYPKTMDLYLQLQNENSLYADPEIKECPLGCGYRFVPDDPNDTVMKCPKCNERFCLQCKVPWHKWKTCKEYIQQNRNIAADQAFITSQIQKGGLRPCPKCNSMVEKNGGCDHMVCSKCKHSYSWCYSNVKSSNFTDLMVALIDDLMH